MKNLKLLGAGLIACLISFSIGKYSGPSSSIKSEKIEETKKTDTVRVVDKKETVLPDGTKITETTSTTKRTTDSNKNTENKTEIKSRPEWRAGLLYFPDIPNFQDKNLILDIQKRIAGELYLGVSASTQKQIGISISLGF